MAQSRHPLWRAADATGGTLDSEGPEAQRRLGQGIAQAAKPDCLGKDSAAYGLFAVLVVPVQVVTNKCK